MKPEDIQKAKNPDLSASFVALQRAAEMARQTAIQTDTALVFVQNGQIVRVTAEQLKQEKAKESLEN